MNKKGKKRVSFLLAAVLLLSTVMFALPSGILKANAAGGKKIDVWDFGAVAEADTSLYNNHVTVDFWNSYENLANDGKFKAGAAEFGDLKLSHNGNDRLFIKAEGAVKNYGDNALATSEYADGYKAAGMYYANGTGGEGRRNVEIANVEAGDVIWFYAGTSNATETTVVFTDGTQKSTGTVKGAEKLTFVAENSGTYKIYFETQGKPIINRVVRIPAVTVSGTVESPVSVDGATIRFIADCGEFTATINGTGFTAALPAGYEFNASLSGVQGYGFTNATKKVTTEVSQAVTGITDKKFSVEEKKLYQYTGKITGFDAGYPLDNLAVTMKASEESMSDDVKLTIGEDMTFSATLEPDVLYTVELAGVNDYEVVKGNTLTGTANTEQNIEVAKKAVYKVSGTLTGLTGEASVSRLTFENLEDGYTYDASVSGGKYEASLRDGSYIAKAEAEGFSTRTHVIVSGAEAEKDLYFVSTTQAPAQTLVKDIYVGFADKENNYATVKEAVSAAKAMNPASEQDRITIHIAPGVYREQVLIEAPYITLKNDTPDQEVKITWYYGIGYKYYSAGNAESALKGFYDEEAAFDKFEKNTVDRWGCTVRVKTDAKGFRAENIVFENSFNLYITDEELADGVECEGKDFVRKYGADVTSKAATERAAAIEVDADESEFYQCTFLSSQDTLYTQTKAKIYFKNCFISGNTDYIFGGGSVVYDGCELEFRGYSGDGAGGYITAMKQDAEDKGALFRNCVITAGPLTVAQGYLGRPWGADAKVVFLNTKLESELIQEAGWTDMSGNKPENANFAEINSVYTNGTAVDVSKRVAGIQTDAKTYQAEDYFGSWTPSYYEKEAATVAFTTPPYLVDNGDINAPFPGHTLTVCYSLGDNDASDASIIRWYRVAADGTETLVKSSTASADVTYKIAAEDVGCIIRAEVLPTTFSGNEGTKASAKLDYQVKEGYDDPDNQGDVIVGDGINIFLAGDSTVKDYSANGMYMGGKNNDLGSWGEFLQSYFNADKVTIANYANGGRSTRNFINEGSLDKIIENISEGDYLFIQFGHNDCANSSGYLEDRYVPLGAPDTNGIYPVTAGTKVATPSSLVDKYGETFYSYDCGGTYKWYIKQYIDAAKSKGAIPVVMSPVSRMYYTEDGTIRDHHDATDTATNTLTSSGNAYVEACRQIAQEEDVLFIDAFNITKTLFEDAYKAGGAKDNGVALMAEGDSTHCNKLGGFIEAGKIARAIEDLKLDISTAVITPSQVLGETANATPVFVVNGDGIFTAYDINSKYTAKSEYWTKFGQDLLKEIGENVPVIKPDTPDKPDTPVTPDTPTDSGTLEEPKQDLTISNSSTVQVADANISDNAVVVIGDQEIPLKDVKGLEVVVVNVTDEGIKSAAKKAIENAGFKLPESASSDFMDISLKSGAEVVRLAQGKVEITVAPKEGIDLTKVNVKVYHIEKDTAKELDVSISEAGITFVTDSFSPFVVVYEPIEETEDKPVDVQTGDTNVLWIYMLLMMMSAGIFAAAGMRRKVS